MAEEREYPEQTYYPSAKVRFSLRFEEAGLKEVVKEKLPKKVTTTLKGTKDPDGTQLEVVDDPSAPPGVKRLLLKEAAGVSGGKPNEQEQSADKFTHFIGAIIPLEANLSLNGQRTADTLSLKIAYHELPFDPRTVRSCAVQFYLGTVTAEAYRAGQEGVLRADGNGEAEPLHVVPDTYSDENGVNRTNLRFEGWVDVWENDWPDDAPPTINLECRDNTTILLDQAAPPKLVIGVKEPLDKAIATYLSNFPQFTGLSVEYRPSDEEAPKLESVLAKSAYKPELGPPPSKGGGAADGLKVWDYLTDVCGALGHICRLEGTTIIIQRVITQTASTAAVRPDDPYRARSLPSGEAIRRRMIYGRNIKGMTVRRKYGQGTPSNIEVRCYLAKRKKTIVARFPEKGDNVAGTARPGDGRSDQKWLVMRVSGIEDEKTLKVVAQTIYESIGRNEIQVRIRTDNMSSFGGGNSDPDLLDLRAGDPLDVFVNREEDEYNTVTQLEQILLIQSKATDFVKPAGYGQNIADAYAKAYAETTFQTTLRLKELQIDWDVEGGVSLSLECINYIEVRLEQEPVE